MPVTPDEPDALGRRVMFCKTLALMAWRRVRQLGRVRYHDQLRRQTWERSWLFLMSVVFIMSTGERPDRPAGLRPVSGYEPQS